MLTQDPQANPQPVTETPRASAPLVTNATTTRAWLTERIDVRVAIGLFVAWLVLTEIAVLLEPPARRSEGFIGTLIGVTMSVLFFGTLAGLVARRRWGLAVSLVGALFSTVAVIACPVSGHHQFGTWWYGEMACMVALVGISVAALSHQSASTERPRSR